jgi:molybdenum cofactor biosynthesis enzyme
MVGVALKRSFGAHSDSAKDTTPATPVGGDTAATDGSHPNVQPVPARHLKRRRRASARKAVPLTAKQTEAMQLVGEHKGNIAAAARAAGKSRAAMAKLYTKACHKLGTKAVKQATHRLPIDRRGQATVSAKKKDE